MCVCVSVLYMYVCVCVYVVDDILYADSANLVGVHHIKEVEPGVPCFMYVSSEQWR